MGSYEHARASRLGPKARDEWMTQISEESVQLRSEFDLEIAAENQNYTTRQKN